MQKEETNQALRLVNDQRNSQMANQIFCFQIKRTPWMAQCFPDCVIGVRLFCFEPSLWACAILLVFEKFTRAYLFQIALEIM